jgi:hypothetical protein
MNEPIKGKPFPDITDQTRPFWWGAADGKLMMQKCTRCGTVNFYPKPWCIECGSREIPWVEVRPTGTVYSHTVAYSVAMNYPAWEAELPLVMCLVDLDDGARMYAQLTGCTPGQVKIGMRVRAHFVPIGEGAGIPTFRPEGHSPG